MQNGRPRLREVDDADGGGARAKTLDLPIDTTLWYQLTDFESQISAVLNRLRAFNDSRSPKIIQLTSAQAAVNALLQFMIKHELAPTAIQDGEPTK